MMWPLFCLMMTYMNLNSEKMITKNVELSPEISNIVIMALSAMMLNELMLMKEDSELEKSNAKTMKIISFLATMTFLISNPLMFLIFMEMTIFPLSYLILNLSKEKDKNESLKFMVLMNTIGSIPFMMFIGFSKYLETKYFLPIWTSKSVTTMMMILFLIKTPIFLFHLWLTKVHVSASGNCSMILASIMIKMGTMGLFKFSEGLEQTKMKPFFLSLAMMSTIYFSIIMIRFFDAKTLIAMSSVLHMALIIPMTMLKKSTSMTSSVMMMSAHGVISYFLFYLVTLNYEMCENRSTMFFKSLESGVKNMALMLFVFMLLNLGIPPFMNFCSEVMFMVSLKMMKSNLSIMMMMISLTLSVLFTMQMNSNILYSKMELVTMKKDSEITMMKFLFFFFLSIMIMWHI